MDTPDVSELNAKDTFNPVGTFPVPPYIDYKKHSLEHATHDFENEYSLNFVEDNRKMIDATADFGPKSYQTSDQEIRARIIKILAGYPDIDLSEIQLSVKEGDAIIAGVVPARRLPGITEAVMSSGLRDLQNRLRAKTK